MDILPRAGVCRGGWNGCGLTARLALYEGGPTMHEHVVQELSRRGFLRAAVVSSADTDAPTRLLTAATMPADVKIAPSPPAQAGLDVAAAEGLPVLAVGPVGL